MSVPDNSATIPAVFFARAAASAERVALIHRDGADYRRVTWQELADRVRRTAAALRRTGCQLGDRVVQLSENRLEWIVADLAILTARAIHVPMHATLAPAQVAAQIGDAEPRAIIVSGEPQAVKLAALGDLNEAGVHVFSHDACPARSGGGCSPILLDDAAAAVPTEDGARIEVKERSNSGPDDVATILYTSGTTGEAKGVMLTHANLLSNTRAMLEIFVTDTQDLRLSLLPWSHVFGRTCDLYAWIVSGATLAVAENRERIVEDCQNLQPTLLNAVPYFFERLYRHAEQQGELETPGVLRQRLGGRIRACCSGGAPLPCHVAQWFERQEVPLVEGYGLTETSPVITADSPRDYRVGTVGRAIPGVEVRIADDGEVLTRGPHVMRGYYNNPTATAEVLRGGWLHTGDLGSLDADGRLTITGRKKELIVTAGGKNVAPAHIEALLTADPLIHQAVVFGDGRNYLVALIVPGPDALKEEILRAGIALASREAALVHPDVYRLYERRIGERLACLSRHEQIGRFRLLGRALSQEAEELTPTLKLRRKVIAEHFAEEIAALYS